MASCRLVALLLSSLVLAACGEERRSEEQGARSRDLPGRYRLVPVQDDKGRIAKGELTIADDLSIEGWLEVTQDYTDADGVGRFRTRRLRLKEKPMLRGDELLMQGAWEFETPMAEDEADALRAPASRAPGDSIRVIFPVHPVGLSAWVVSPLLRVVRDDEGYVQRLEAAGAKGVFEPVGSNR